MPSRPVLIGRGLVPTPYKTPQRQRECSRHASTNQFPDNTPVLDLEDRTEYTHGLDTPRTVTPHPCGDVTDQESVRKSYGGHSARETPGPIPNPEVKPFSAAGTAMETSWE